jgi:hypothetical protein
VTDSYAVLAEWFGFNAEVVSDMTVAQWSMYLSWIGRQSSRKGMAQARGMMRGLV